MNKEIRVTDVVSDLSFKDRSSYTDTVGSNLTNIYSKSDGIYYKKIDSEKKVPDLDVEDLSLGVDSSNQPNAHLFVDEDDGTVLSTYNTKNMRLLSKESIYGNSFYIGTDSNNTKILYAFSDFNDGSLESYTNFRPGSVNDIPGSVIDLNFSSNIRNYATIKMTVLDTEDLVTERIGSFDFSVSDTIGTTQKLSISTDITFFSKFGYTGGGSVTQSTSKGTAVTINSLSGTITTDPSTLNANTSVTFTVNNSTIKSTDMVILNIKSGASNNTYNVSIVNKADGSFKIQLYNFSASNKSENVVISFAILKG